ncbi:MAG: isochorismatase [Acidimicrobiales bacterium mtb01]|nr:isochorismatase family protein [Actinomycetota bacterium]TEX45072.1 MAG: isochorismatase [Acidimicrobiales bacterium mtb01]
MSDLQADYLQAGFGTRLGWGSRPAVLVVDMCRAYVDDKAPLYAAAAADAYRNADRLAGVARRQGLPVVFTRVEYAAGGVDGGHFFRKVPALRCFEAGNPLAEFTDLVRPEPGDVIVTKQYASAFFGTSLAATLNASGVDTVVIAGVSTSGCVRASALDALQNGFVPIVVADACADRDPRPHDANLFDLQAKYADVVTMDDALAHLGGAR